MSDALLALHFQNDICHRDGLISFSLDRSTGEAANFLSVSKRALGEARRAGWTIAHIHIAFAPDYSDLPRDCRLFLKTETLGALKIAAPGAQRHSPDSSPWPVRSS
jgi:nicotinamidase-related amidase